MKPGEAITGALQLLREAGVVAKGGNLSSVELVGPDQVRTHQMQWRPTTAGPLRRWLANRQPGDGPDPGATLFVVPAMRERDLEELNRAGATSQLNVVILTPPRVFLGGTLLTPAPETGAAPRPRKGRPAIGWWALTRTLLLAGGPLTQGELAAASGVSQQAISSALHEKRSHTTVKSTPQGFVVPWAARADLLSELLATYPGPRGVQTFWYGLASPLEQARQVAEYAGQMGVRTVLSGDAAADVYAPWRSPVGTVVYLSGLLDLTAADVVPADETNATLTAVIPGDRTLWATALSSGRPGLVDPVIALWDLHRVGGIDADQATDKLAHAIVNNQLQ